MIVPPGYSSAGNRSTRPGFHIPVDKTAPVVFNQPAGFFGQDRKPPENHRLFKAPLQTLIGAHS
jgi:hypothetical protein